MIIDRVRVAGLAAYLQRSGTPPSVNLGGAQPTTARTPPLARGRQRNVATIQLLFEGGDLTPLLDAQPALTPAGFPQSPSVPLFEVRVNKEMFPGFFGNPFRNRTHTIAGFDDLSSGQLANGRVMEIDDVPTIVSTDAGTCQWSSRIYPLSGPTPLSAAAWELAMPRTPPAPGVSYAIDLETWTWGQPTTGAPTTTTLATGLDPSARRVAAPLQLAGVGALRVSFRAEVDTDAYLYEQHTGTALGAGSLGRPLLRAINLLEPIDSPYAFYSLHEVIVRATELKVLDPGGDAIRRISATLDLPARLVFSDHQLVASPDDFEYVEVAVRTDAFSRLTARLDAEEASRIEEA